ncbi:gluzincin family metallopeptidase [Chitinophaga filiformis]|uniref:Peptidase M4 n=1 Tax=Chitinophaga filiformis TaxID=104663 RepID=A0A1G7Z990_CHIFI|nr:hypothetical protein [Chitinophaga filiformis]SDH05303.1 hypothetical protein SAMN04488121_108183 [Chitinophaga filiformis]
MIKKPPFRKLRGYAFDPSLSLNLDTAVINNITYKVRWEDKDDPDPERRLKSGPRGEYLEVVDYDPTVDKFYAPVDLDHPYILAQDGLNPSGSNPQFHQQMVYAVAMTTIKNFEAGLGRPVLWSSRQVMMDEQVNGNPPEKKATSVYVPTLRIYPHAMREANAYYSPQKKALLFGYFSAQPADVTLQMPDALTFTCLSHDIIAHETTHAILDGLHQSYTESSNPDVLAFHEAFADIVALFQHFTFSDVLKNQIAATRGDLAAQNLLGKLAQEFGIAIGSYGSLRDAIGTFDKKTKTWKPNEPNGDEYRKFMEPHQRGAILVSAIFEAFLSIYKNRISDLLRIASNGSGILPQGQLSPDLVNRMAAEAGKTAQHVLNMCIRALDYCPPVDITFGDYLRGIITADTDLVEDDSRDYRLAFIDAFRKRGIYPSGIKHLSIESLTYSIPDTSGIQGQINVIVNFLREYRSEILNEKRRSEIFKINKKYIAGQYDDNAPKIYGLHRRLLQKFDNSIQFEKLTGLLFSEGARGLGISTSHAYGNDEGNWPSVSIQSLHLASRVGPDGNQVNQIIVTMIQRAYMTISRDGNREPVIVPGKANGNVRVLGGCTLIFDLDSLQLRYAISKPLLDLEKLNEGVRKLNKGRCSALFQHHQDMRIGQSRFEAYFSMGPANSKNEPFCFLHTH